MGAASPICGTRCAISARIVTKAEARPCHRPPPPTPCPVAFVGGMAMLCSNVLGDLYGASMDRPRLATALDRLRTQTGARSVTIHWFNRTPDRLRHRWLATCSATPAPAGELSLLDDLNPRTIVAVNPVHDGVYMLEGRPIARMPCRGSSTSGRRACANRDWGSSWARASPWGRWARRGLRFMPGSARHWRRIAGRR